MANRNSKTNRQAAADGATSPAAIGEGSASPAVREAMAGTPDQAIPFDQFMALALYGEGGYYSKPRPGGRGPTGRAGDFFTSVSVGELFAVRREPNHTRFDLLGQRELHTRRRPVVCLRAGLGEDDGPDVLSARVDDRSR